MRFRRIARQLTIVGYILSGIYSVEGGVKEVYYGLILASAGPFHVVPNWLSSIACSDFDIRSYHIWGETPCISTGCVTTTKKEQEFLPCNFNTSGMTENWSHGFVSLEICDYPYRADTYFCYVFCRISNDLIDDAEDKTAARQWIIKLITFFDTACAPEISKNNDFDFVPNQ